METPFTVYKLIILYMLQNSEAPLTNSEISEFILDREYTNYFHLQQSLSELVETGLTAKDTVSNSSYYSITEDGKNTLPFFENDLSEEIKKEIRDYLKNKGCEIKPQILTPSDYYLNNQGEYVVHLQLIEKTASVIDLTIAAPSLEAAQAMCKKWGMAAQNIYGEIMEELL